MNSRADQRSAAHVGERSRPGDDESPRVLLHVPVNIGSVSLAVIAVIACAFAMQWAKAVLAPILLGVMLSYALAPLVDRLQRWRLPRPVGAGLLLSAIVSAGAWGVWTLSDDASDLIDTLPQVAQKLHQLSSLTHGSTSTIDKVQRAALEIQKATEESSTGRPASSRGERGAAAETAPPPGVTRVVVERNGLNVRDYLLTGTLGAFTFIGQASVVMLISLFLLASGNNFRRKMVKLAGPRLEQKKITVQALDEITEQIQRYLLVQVVVSVLVGVATWIAFFAIGLRQSAVWGVFAGLTNLIPYVGALAVGAGSSLVAFIQFDTIDMALLAGGSSLAVHAVVGNLVTPWLTGRASRMSPFAVFVGVLAFGWLWGIPGLLLGVPILMVVKSICDRVDDLKPIGELLSA